MFFPLTDKWRVDAIIQINTERRTQPREQNKTTQDTKCLEREKENWPLRSAARSSSSAAQPNYCPNSAQENGNSQENKGTALGFLWTHHGYTHICSSALDTGTHLSFEMWLQIFLCISGSSFNLFTLTGELNVSESSWHKSDLSLIVYKGKFWFIYQETVTNLADS